MSEFERNENDDTKDNEQNEDEGDEEEEDEMNEDKEENEDDEMDEEEINEVLTKLETKLSYILSETKDEDVYLELVLFHESNDWRWFKYVFAPDQEQTEQSQRIWELNAEVIEEEQRISNEFKKAFEVKVAKSIFENPQKSDTKSSFQFFLLDDVRDQWKNMNPNTEFRCSNPYDMITQDPITEPISDNRIFIYFSNGIIECWDAYGITAYVASQIANNQIPVHPTDREEYTYSTIALLGYVHGILRDSDQGIGIKKKYMQEIFEKYKNDINAELILSEVSKTFDNPTIAFKKMVCDRKQWFEDNKTPEGLCSAQPLKQLINFAQYQKDLISKVKLAMTKNQSVPKSELRKRTVTGADLPEPNEQYSAYRKIN